MVTKDNERVVLFKIIQCRLFQFIFLYHLQQWANTRVKASRQIKNHFIIIEMEMQQLCFTVNVCQGKELLFVLDLIHQKNIHLKYLVCIDMLNNRASYSFSSKSRANIIDNFSDNVAYVPVCRQL